MNIVLATSPAEHDRHGVHSLPPLSIAYIAAGVKNLEGVAVSVVDAYGEDLGMDKAVERVLAQSPDVLGLSTTNVCFRDGLKLLKKVKQAKPDVVTVMGGTIPRPRTIFCSGKCRSWTWWFEVKATRVFVNSARGSYVLSRSTGRQECRTGSMATLSGGLPARSRTSTRRRFPTVTPWITIRTTSNLEGSIYLNPTDGQHGVLKGVSSPVFLLLKTDARVEISYAQCGESLQGNS